MKDVRARLKPCPYILWVEVKVVAVGAKCGGLSIPLRFRRDEAVWVGL